MFLLGSNFLINAGSINVKYALDVCQRLHRAAQRFTLTDKLLPLMVIEWGHLGSPRNSKVPHRGMAVWTLAKRDQSADIVREVNRPDSAGGGGCECNALLGYLGMESVEQSCTFGYCATRLTHPLMTFFNVSR